MTNPVMTPDASATLGFVTPVLDHRTASLQPPGAQQLLPPPIPQMRYAYPSHTDVRPPVPSPSDAASAAAAGSVTGSAYQFGSSPAFDTGAAGVADVSPAKRHARTVTAAEIGIRDAGDPISSQGALYFQYDRTDHADGVSKKEGDAAAAAGGTQPDSTHDDQELLNHDELPMERTAEDDRASAVLLQKLPRILLIRPRTDLVLPEHTISLEDCAHPQDWLQHVRRKIPITNVRFHKHTLFLCSEQMVLDVNDASIWLKGVQLPLDDEVATKLNARFKRVNDKHDKESFDAARSGQELGAVRLPYAFITAVTDHTFVPGLPFSRVCTSERPQDDFNIAADAKNQYGSLPDARYKATSGSMPTSGKAIMNSKDVKTESLAVLDSIDGTFNLATTICGFDPAHVMYLRDWSNRQDAFFTQPLQRYYAPSFDICSPTCPPNCTQHQQHCLLGTAVTVATLWSPLPLS